MAIITLFIQFALRITEMLVRFTIELMVLCAKAIFAIITAIVSAVSSKRSGRGP